MKIIRCEFVNMAENKIEIIEETFRDGSRFSLTFGDLDVFCREDGTLEISGGLKGITVHPKGANSIIVSPDVAKGGRQ